MGITQQVKSAENTHLQQAFPYSRTEGLLDFDRVHFVGCAYLSAVTD